MTPLESFLAQLHPEALHQGAVVLQEGEVTFGTPNHKVLHRLVREHYARGQEVMKGFVRWLIREEGYPENQAASRAASVWNLLCLTYDATTGTANPLQLLEPSDPTYGHAMKMHHLVALRMWARYKKDVELYERLLLWNRKLKQLETPKLILDEIQRLPPYSRKEYKALLRAVEGHRGSPRFPWGHSCLRLIFAAGASPQEVSHLTPQLLREAVATDHLSVRTRAGGTYRLWVEPLKAELELLLAMPCEWGTLLDLIDPGHIGRRGNATNYHALRVLVNSVYQKAKVFRKPSWVYLLRATIAYELWRTTRNSVSAAQILRRRDVPYARMYFQELEKAEKEASNPTPPE